MLGGRDDLLLFDWLVGEKAHFGFILGVEVGVILRNMDVDLAAAFEFVVAFGAPGYVVRVAKGVDVEDVNVGWREEKVLDELFAEC